MNQTAIPPSTICVLRRRLALASLALALCVTLLTSAAQAAPITIAFTGQIDVPFGGFSQGPLAHIVSPFSGTEGVSGSLTFDSEVVGTANGLGTDSVSFTNAVSDFTITIGDFTATGPGSPSVLTSHPRANSIGDPSFFGEITALTASDLGTSESESFFFNLDYGPSNQLARHPGLPTTFPALGSLGANTRWSLDFIGPDLTTVDLRTQTSSLTGTFTSFQVIPEPSTALLLALGLVCLGRKPS